MIVTERLLTLVVYFLLGTTVTQAWHNEDRRTAITVMVIIVLSIVREWMAGW